MDYAIKTLEEEIERHQMLIEVTKPLLGLKQLKLEDLQKELHELVEAKNYLENRGIGLVNNIRDVIEKQRTER